MKSTKLGRKSLSLILSLVMIFSCLVFAAPVQSNAASAGTYYVKVTINVNQSVKDTHNEEYSVTLTHQAINGTGSSSTESATAIAMTSTGTKTYTWSGKGFPTGLKFVANGKGSGFLSLSTEEGKYYVQKVEVGPSSSNLTTIFAGSILMTSTTNSYNGTLSTGCSWSSNNDSYAKVESTTTSNWVKPYASSMSLGTVANQVCPASGSKTASVTYSATDQYGVVMASSLCTMSVSGSNKSTGISINNGHSGTDTITITSSANIAGATNSQTVTVNSSWSGSSTKSTSKTFTLTDAQYDVNFYNYDGATPPLKTQSVYYGSAATAPSEPTREFDTENHYTFNAWNKTFSNITADTDVTATFTSTPHKIPVYDKNGTNEYIDVVVAPTCETAGTGTFHCTDGCGYSIPMDIPALGHSKVAVDVAPTDQTPGYVYYKCENCDKVWVAQVDTSTGALTPATEPSTSIDEVIANTDPVPAPSFNTFSDPLIGYDYSNRGAGIKLDNINYVDENTVQDTRFTGSMLVPNGIDYSFSSDKNSVTDFGFVYSQSELIDYDISALENGKNNVYKMSVASQNSGTFTGKNWTGVSTHETENGTYLTFNLLIGIKAKNWTKDYCARAYITYNYMGFTYTVYDQDFSSRSVQYIAENVVANETETEFARNYCQTKILDHIV